MRIFITSDTHFGHKNIIKYCKRPFESVEEMDCAIRDIWNSLVNPKDIVFHLGDFALNRSGKYSDLPSHLNGKKILVKGNHDDAKILTNPSWERVCETFNLPYKGLKIRMRHHPWVETKEPNTIFLHGHTHGNQGDWHNGQIDVGVDSWDFAPVDLEEIIEFWNSQS
jgi:calcineurin-like phosphoesterase family protein